MVVSKTNVLSVLVALQIFICVGSANYGFVCPSLFDYYPDPVDCGAFYRCMYGSAFRMNCPAGTLWSQRLLTCDHSYNVPCVHVGVVSSTYPSYDWYNYDNGVAGYNQQVDTTTTVQNTVGANEFVAGNTAYAVQHDSQAVDYSSNQGYGYAAGYQYPRPHWPALAYGREPASGDSWTAQGGYETYSPWFQRLMSHGKKK